MADDYAPFPEVELRELAAATPVAFVRNTLHNAIASHVALRERCLLAEMDRNQLQFKLDGKSHVVA